MTPYPFQREAVDLIKSRKFTLLADEQGLGKTLQAIYAAKESAALRVLIICPASLKLMWEQQLFELWPACESVIINSTKDKVGQRWSGMYPMAAIVSYDLAAKVSIHQQLRHFPWDWLIIDEAHYLKSINTKRTLAILGTKKLHGLVQSANQVLALTGTPMPSRPIELWPLLYRCCPEVIGSMTHHDFGLRYASGRLTPYGWDYRGASHTWELAEKLKSVMIRRTKKEVLPQLPDKIYQTIVFKPETPDMKRLVKYERDYEAAALKDITETPEIPFETLSTIRREMALVRLPLVIEHIENALVSVDKVVIFAHHREVIHGLAHALKHYTPAVLVGGMSSRAQADAVTQFQESTICRVFLGNFAAAGVGHTLHASSTVILAELDWTPGVVEQCVDRVHRIGQIRGVLVQALVVDGSLDQRMASTLFRKQKVIKRVVG